MAFQDLRGILQYVPLFRGKTFVVALDGGVISGDSFPNVLLDLAVLHSLSIRVVLVHGARDQIRSLARRRSVTLTNDDGTGPTDEATLEVSVDAISRLTSDLHRDLTSVGLRAATANAVKAHPAGVIDGVEFESTGRIDKIDVESLDSFLREGIIPVLSPLGYDGRATLRMNSDEMAMEVGIALKVEKILYLGDEEPLLADNLRQLGPAAALRNASLPSLDPGLASKLRYAARACERGVPRVHLLDGVLEEVLLAELFSNEGVGVMVHGDDYRHARPATEADIPELLSMMRHSMEDGELLVRDRETMLREIDDFQVLEVDGNAVACVALHRFEANSAEVACLFVKRDHEGRGYGGHMVAEAENRAFREGHEKVFALSTQAYRFFEEKLGYVEDAGFCLPPAREASLEASGRNGKVLVKRLGTPTAS